MTYSHSNAGFAWLALGRLSDGAWPRTMLSKSLDFREPGHQIAVKGS
jgi:hypothetical protein